jgi:UrcA family protein
MNTLMQRAVRGATLVIALTAAVPVVLAAGSAAAQVEYRVKVGDLSQPEQAAAFNRRLDDMASQFCTNESPDVVSRKTLEACRKAVRDEAMSQLTRPQRDQYAAVANGMGALARAGQ